MFLNAKTAQGLQHASSALRLDPGHEPAMRLRKRIRDIERLKDEGNQAFKAGELELAIEKYSAALDVRLAFAFATFADLHSIAHWCRRVRRKGWTHSSNASLESCDNTVEGSSAN